VHLIYAESEREILKSMLAKWRQHEELTRTMSDLIREHGLSRASVEQALTRSLGVARVEARVTGGGWSTTTVSRRSQPDGSRRWDRRASA
jgi:hypothetical protein